MDSVTTSTSSEYDSSSECADGGKAQRDDPVLEAKHKIFLCHSGAQKNFVEQLCLDIERRHRYPFFDKRRGSLAVGDNVYEVIMEAIQQCVVGVVILSFEFFTQTKWPMLELAAMVKQREKNKEFIIMPVFLGITPAQCRDKMIQREWIQKWINWARDDDRINIEDWKAALKVFGSTLGLLFNENVGEVKLREEIVEAVCKVVLSDIRWDDSHVQGRSRLCAVVREMIKEARPRADGVRVVGLYGVGGIGKTTLCKALCNEFSKEFRDKVCHMDLESKSEEELLREVLCRLTDTRPEFVAGLNKDHCLYRLKQDLSKQIVFLAIDNAGVETRTIEQAQTYLREFIYKEGSIIVVTALSRWQFQNLDVVERECYEMPELNFNEARCLLLSNASRKLQRWEEFVGRCVERCFFHKGDGMGGHHHPLTLKVLGAQLGNDPEEWQDRLDERDPFNQLGEEKHPVFSILRKRYDALVESDQDLFMDVAFYYPSREGSRFGTGHYTWNIFEWLSMVHATSVDKIRRRLKGLQRKSLIVDLGDGSRGVGIHDLWREFCRTETKCGGTKSRYFYEELEGSIDGYEECGLYGGGWSQLKRAFIVLQGDNGSQGWAKSVNFCLCSNLTVLKLVRIDSKEALVLNLSALKSLKSLEILVHHRAEICGCHGLEIQGLGMLRDLRVLIMCSPPNHIRGCIEEIASLVSLRLFCLVS